MLRRRALFALAVIAIAAALPAACGSSGDASTSSKSASAGTGAGAAGAGGAGQGGDVIVGGADDLVSIDVSPKNPVVEVLNGAIPPALAFTATGTTMGGTTVPVTCQWSFDRFDVATIDESSGAFTATGLLGGTGKVTCKTPMVSGSTTATVKLHFTSDPQNVDPTIKGQFGGASQPDPAMTLVYPYDHTVFPRGLLGPTVQWNGGGAADVYYVHATSPTFDAEWWGTVPPPSRWDFPLAPDAIWRKLTDSTDGEVKVDIQRFDGVAAYLAKTQSWSIAPANLAGTIYYWEINNGNVVRIKPGANAPQAFLAPVENGCVACHSVSKDGARIVAAMAGGWSPWVTFDAATGVELFYSNTSSGFEAISPTGTHVLSRHWVDGAFNGAGYLSLTTFDGITELAQLNPGTGQPSHPAWSGDGDKIAFSVRTDGNGLDFTTSTLWMANVDLANPSFSNIGKIVDNDAARPTVTYPTFSPDSKWIAFERCTQARSRGSLGTVWLTNLDGSVQMPLDAANGVGSITGDDQLNAAYEPTFNPVSAGGYFWLVFVSERMYGNTLTDTNPNTRHKQLWVTAIDAKPTQGKDPSHPGFWLPGQEIANQNMRGEWALSPCKKKGETCDAGFECCDGFCHADDGGQPTCSDMPGGCSGLGEACTTAADCCDPAAVCVGGFCSKQPN